MSSSFDLPGREIIPENILPILLQQLFPLLGNSKMFLDNLIGKYFGTEGGGPFTARGFFGGFSKVNLPKNKNL